MSDAPPRTRKKAVTIYDVARHAKVSIKTVSMVLNNLPVVKAETRARVEAAMAALAYHPNQLARGLASQRSFMLGLFCDDPTSGYATALHRGALLECRRRHYHLIVEPLALDMPGCIAQGDDDQIVPIAASGELSAKLVKGAQLKVYKGFPHGMPVSEAEIINKDLLAFIQS